MLIEMSDCGAVLDLEQVPAPDEALGEPLRWLEAFPSFGYLLTVAPARAREVKRNFEALGVHAASVGKIVDGHSLDITYRGETQRYWDLTHGSLLGFSQVGSTGGLHA